MWSAGLLARELGDLLVMEGERINKFARNTHFYLNVKAIAQKAILDEICKVYFNGYNSELFNYSH